jgi:hypothetical protein
MPQQSASIGIARLNWHVERIVAGMVVKCAVLKLVKIIADKR